MAQRVDTTVNPEEPTVPDPSTRSQLAQPGLLELPARNTPHWRSASTRTTLRDRFFIRGVNGNPHACVGVEGGVQHVTEQGAGGDVRPASMSRVAAMLGGTLARRLALLGGGFTALASTIAAGPLVSAFPPAACREPRALRVEGLEGRVEISRDRWGVPHVHAATDLDLWFGQGFCHGQDRLWQVDLYRRIGSGRLAEIAGTAGPGHRPLHPDAGIATRRRARGRRARAGHPLRGWTPYCAGVNAAAADRPLPAEFQVLRQRFEPFVPADALTMTKLLSYGLSTNWERELLRAEMTRELGPELAAAPGSRLSARAIRWCSPRRGLEWRRPRARRADREGARHDRPGGRGHGLEQLGRQRRALGDGTTADGRRPAPPPSMPGITYQVGL